MRAEVSTCPSSSWNSRARRARSCSTRASRWLASRRSSARERSRSCCACFSAVTSKIKPCTARSPSGVISVVARICSQRGVSTVGRLRPTHSNSRAAAVVGSRQTSPALSSGWMPAKKTSESASIAAAVPGSRRATPSLIERNAGEGVATYSNNATGNWLDICRRRPSEARSASSAWRRRAARPCRRCHDQSAKAMVAASVMAIRTMADRVSCRVEATAISSAAWAIDTQGTSVSGTSGDYRQGATLPATKVGASATARQASLPSGGGRLAGFQRFFLSMARVISSMSSSIELSSSIITCAPS